ncbi:hypothetical protein MKW94_012774 [Papaver nudicaule]|uniref:Plant thionin family protein n=1 Tax=Papaver nudicaule TaxID=74823 RepID=A0AA41VZY4_PAPNU|nr:hypothetical protein [Papaver nudicaule]
MAGKMNFAVTLTCFIIFVVVVQTTQADSYTECLTKCYRDTIRGSPSPDVPSRDCVIRCDSEIAKAKKEPPKEKYRRRIPHQ